MCIIRKPEVKSLEQSFNRLPLDYNAIRKELKSFSVCSVNSCFIFIGSN